MPVLVSPVTAAYEGASGFLDGFSMWPLIEFRAWVTATLAKIRELRTSFNEPGDLEWRARAHETFITEKISLSVILDDLSGRTAKRVLRVDVATGDGDK